MVSQFPRSEFLSVLPPGLFVLTAAFAAANVQSSQQTLWAFLSNFAVQIQNAPLLLLFLLLGSYLLGSVLRALPVNWVERLVPPFGVQFPYPTVIEDVLKTFLQNQSLTGHDVTSIPSINGQLPMHVFNFWKDVLCVSSPGAFEYYQTFETRVRLFAGLTWASSVGVLCAGVAAVRLETVSSPLALAIFLLSAMMLVAFGLNFRRVRRQEVRVLFMLYVATNHLVQSHERRYAKRHRNMKHFRGFHSVPKRKTFKSSEPSETSSSIT